MILLHIHDEEARPPASRRLAAWTVLAVPLPVAVEVEGGDLRHWLFDVDLTSVEKARHARAIAARLDPGCQRIFACPPGHHHAITQARALGATHLVERPISDASLLRALPPAVSRERPGSTLAGALALDLAFRSLAADTPLVPGFVERVAANVVTEIGEIGIEPWLDSIRAHHSGTYQHCLIVTGLASAFAQELGLPAADIERLTLAALLHDIGKARIDLAILDKQGPLTPAERRVIEMHPVWGADHLAQNDAVAPEIREVVRHHHELLDGSGYPDGLRGGEIGDLTRLVTIVDVFGALIERRSYKPPMSGEAAYLIIRRMAQDGKLELALTEAFRPVAAKFKDLR